ncbi:MAG: hypothetical protein GY842_22755 [bacterium]|nr:hypothetical protein [bacterium]
MDNKSFAIGVLSITTVILLVGLLVIHSQPQPAFASAGPGIESGDYVVATGQFLPDEHLLYVVDSISQRLVVYRFDVRSKKTFNLVHGEDLALLRERTASQQQSQQQTKPRTRRGRRP